MHIQVDKKTGALEINLPADLAGYRRAVEAAINEEFAFEPLNQATLVQMNAFLYQWFNQQGITLPENPDNDLDKGEQD